jgi:YhcN/YlaJ family sporulation lipoprotein
MFKRKFLVFSASLLLIMLVITACAPARRPDINDNDNNRPQQQTRFIPRQPAPVPNPVSPRTAQDDVPNTSYMNRTRKISDRIEDLKEVETAACIITGNTALVGIQFDEQYKGTKTDAIKEKVEKAAKAADARVNNVVVTAEPDTLSRIQSILRDVGQGRPISGFTEEINELINRVQPK